MLKRSHLAGTLRPEHAGQAVTVCGWINTFRDQGKGLIFCDVRDRTGLVQAVFDVAQVPPEVVTAAKAMRREDVVAIRGTVRRRAGEPNPKLATGEVEILAAEVEILNKTETPPILPDEHEAGKIAEEIRLKHRYIDLRRPRMQSILATRSRITKLAPWMIPPSSWLRAPSGAITSPASAAHQMRLSLMSSSASNSTTTAANEAMFL